MIFSENRFPPPGQARGRAFSGSCSRRPAMLFVRQATDKRDILTTRAKFYRAHRVHLDEAATYDVDVVTAGTLVADDGETPVGSIFVIHPKEPGGVGSFCHHSPN